MPEWWEQYRQEQHNREMLDLQRRQTAAAERQAQGHGGGGIIVLLILGLVIVGAVWFVFGSYRSFGEFWGERKQPKISELI
jgi:hypothetical protein